MALYKEGMLKQTALAATGLILLAAACDGGSSGPPPTQSPSPAAPQETTTAQPTTTRTPSAVGTLSPDVLAALGTYLSSTGLDDQTYRLYEFVDCAVAALQPLKEDEVCTLGTNSVGPEAASVLVTLPEGDIWELTVEKQDGLWEVTGARKIV